jgi:Zn-dependent protease
MRTSITFGYAAGIPLKIHLTWLITAALVTWSLSKGYFPYYYPGWENWTYWLLGLFTTLLFFASVLLHELGHSLVALNEGVNVNSITLFIFGGVAHIDREPETAGSEFRIVLAGPLTSLTLAAGFSIIGSSGILGLHMSSAALYLGQMNLILALFNLLPGFPLDGGRILRSALWKFSKDYFHSTRRATNVGVGVAGVFIISGISLAIWGDLFSGGWIAFIGLYLGIAAKDGYRQVEIAGEEPARENIYLVDEINLEDSKVIDKIYHEEKRGGLWYENAYSSVFIMVRVVKSEGKRYLESKKVEHCSEFTSLDYKEEIKPLKGKKR